MAREDALLSLGDVATVLLTQGTGPLRLRYRDAPLLVLRQAGEQQPGLIHTQTAIPVSKLLEEGSLDDGHTDSIDRAELQATADTRKFVKVSAWARMAQADTMVVPVKKSDRNPFLGFISVGRARNNDICINSQSISKLHATISSAEGAWTIVDKSSNGTWVEKVRLKRETPHPLLHGHQLSFAEVNGMFLDLNGLEALCHSLGR